MESAMEYIYIILAGICFLITLWDIRKGDEGGGQVLRTALALSALIALVSGTIVAGHRLGMLRRAPVSVDLRKPTTAT